MNSAGERCGVVAIIGEPNAGKSTLINQLVGGKVSIVTPKVQTTRFNVRGICHDDKTQLILVDTPGIFDAQQSFEKAMVNAAWAGIGDADAALLLVDCKAGIRESTRALFHQLTATTKPLFLALNKIDKVSKERLIELAASCGELGLFRDIFMISAKTGDGVGKLKTVLAQSMPPGPWHYPDDEVSDISMRLLAAEITREKLFLLLSQELPYSLLVETESWQESDTLIKITQAIYIQRENQKKIVIGEGGAMIKRVGISARRELEKMTDKKIHLELFVKVRPNWKDDRESYRLLGLEYKQ
ncbi:MAG: GTPase Era [Alphaproteobacteria bacterium]|nr:GTPase Era [Alphaproteobacteria bacterium]